MKTLREYRVTYRLPGDIREAWTFVRARNKREALRMAEMRGVESYHAENHGEPMSQKWWDLATPEVQRQ